MTTAVGRLSRLDLSAETLAQTGFYARGHDGEFGRIGLCLETPPSCQPLSPRTRMQPCTPSPNGQPCSFVVSHGPNLAQKQNHETGLL
jgi:hypothetical protein